MRVFSSHRTWMAAEAVLVVGLLRSVMETWLKATGLPNYGKVLLIMAGTVGLLGGLYWLIESMTSAGIKQTHTILGSLSLPRVLVHVAIFAVLVLMYATQEHLPLW